MTGEVPSALPGDHDPGRPSGSPPRLALYRRYRPATFAEVRGQDHVTEPLRQALRTGRVHHAYLFSGPRGCGKTSSARILARSLNCAEGPTPDPCGNCESCLALAPDGPGSLDVIEIDAASHGGVDDARDLRERAFYAPVSGRFKIYIIDEAHMVTREGFNALLKLVEEPPPHLKFVFATTEPEKVIATIRSRTHHYPFRLVPPAVLRDLLEQILATEQIPFEPAVLPLVVRAGAGSVRDSLSVLDQLLAGADEEGLRYDRTVALLGYTDDNLLDEVTDAFADDNGAAVFGAVNRVMEGGHDPRRFAADLLDRFRDLIVLATVPDAGQTGLLDVPADRLERMTGQAERFGRAQLTRAAEIVSEGLVQMRGATSPRLLLELMCAQILLPGAGTGEKDLLARLERLERRLDGGAGPGHSPSGQAPPAASAHTASEHTASALAGPARAAAPPASPPGAARRPGPSTPSPPPSPSSTPGVHARPGGPSGTEHGPAPAPRPAAPPQAAPPPAARATSAARATPATQAGPATFSQPTAPSRAAGPAGTESVRDRWPQILEAVKEQRRVSWMLLRAASVHSVEDRTLILQFPGEGQARGFSASGHDQVLAAALQSVLGVTLRIKAMSAAQLAATSGAPHGSQPGAEELSRPASGTVRAEPPAPPAEAGPPRTLSPKAQIDSAPAEPGTVALTGMDLIRRELGGQVIAEIDET